MIGYTRIDGGCQQKATDVAYKRWVYDVQVQSRRVRLKSGKEVS